jgi:hypothetical protein
VTALRDRLIHHAGFTYRVTRVGNRYEISMRCDCILGPHWHEQKSCYSLPDVKAWIRDHR